MSKKFTILFEDDFFIVINKPPGLLVHRTRISEDEQFVLQLLRDQIGRRIYPVHRLDRGTSGVLLFGKTKEAASVFSVLIREKKIEKRYLALVRGFVKAEGVIDYPLKLHESEERQDAVSNYHLIAHFEIARAINRYPTSRYSFVSVQPETGRWHQIRRHFAHLRHPVIGDKRHGDNKHNNYFREQLGFGRMMLHASALKFVHPDSGETIVVEAMLEDEMAQTIDWLKQENLSG